MNKEYRELDISYGSTLEDVVNSLLSYKEMDILAYVNFNGVKLFSDTVSMDNAYKEMYGVSKDEFDKHKEIETVELLIRQIDRYLESAKNDRAIVIFNKTIAELNNVLNELKS